MFNPKDNNLFYVYQYLIKIFLKEDFVSYLLKSKQPLNKKTIINYHLSIKPQDKDRQRVGHAMGTLFTNKKINKNNNYYHMIKTFKGLVNNQEKITYYDDSLFDEFLKKEGDYHEM